MEITVTDFVFDDDDYADVDYSWMTREEEAPEQEPYYFSTSEDGHRLHVSP